MGSRIQYLKSGDHTECVSYFSLYYTILLISNKSDGDNTTNDNVWCLMFLNLSCTDVQVDVALGNTASGVFSGSCENHLPKYAEEF